MVHHGNVVVLFAAAVSVLCAPLATAYPTPMERAAGDSSNYQPLRNSASRDFERFIDSIVLCNDDAECDLRSVLQTTERGSLDRLSGGYPLAAKRSSLDRLNGGHTMAARKRDSLNRLNAGHMMGAKRGSLDRLNGILIGYAADDDRVPDDAAMMATAAKRDSLDRLNAGHTMAAKRGGQQLDRATVQQLHRWTDLVAADGGRAVYYVDGGANGAAISRSLSF